jgi:hypothetical protein
MLGVPLRARVGRERVQETTRRAEPCSASSPPLTASAMSPAGRCRVTLTCMLDGRTFRAKSFSGAICALARDLIAVGVPDQAWEMVNTAAPETVALSGPSIHAMAALQVREDSRLGVRYERPKPSQSARQAPPASLARSRPRSRALCPHDRHEATCDAQMRTQARKERSGRTGLVCVRLARPRVRILARAVA